MDKIARNDWKRHSAPYDLAFDLSTNRGTMGEIFDQAMEAFTSGDPGEPEVHTLQHHRTSTMSRERKKTTICVFDPEKTELSTDQYTPGVLKVFGETILPGVQYKSVLASCRSTAQELVKQALERFGLRASNYKHYVLCDVVGSYESGEINNSVDEHIRSDKWERLFTRLLSDKDKPLLLQKFWKPIEGYSRRYELHERARVTDIADDDDTSGLNENARKILISKLRPGAIPLFDASTLGRDSDGLRLSFSNMRTETANADSSDSETSQGRLRPAKKCSHENDTAFPMKHPFFLNIRGFDVKRDKTIYVIKFKRFNFGNPCLKSQKQAEDVPKFSLFAPDINSVHCSFKVYRFKRNNGTSNPVSDRNNYFLELDPLSDNISLNGQKLHGKAVMKSGDILNIGIYYVFLFKDCSKGFDIPLMLPWLAVPAESRGSESEADSCDLKLTLPSGEDESNSNTDDSTDMSVNERMCFSYSKEKEDELVRYICAIIQQQNTCKTYPLTVAFIFSMCIEHASRNFERRQLKHLFLRTLFTVRENVADTAKSLSAGTCTLLDVSVPTTERDQKLERMLLWISNCVQLLLYLKHTFHLPEVQPLSDRGSARDQKTLRKEDSVKHGLGQLVTGLEEIIMFCFQKCVYTITKALHPVLIALLNSDPFSDANSEQCSMEDIIRMFETLAEVTHSVMLHEGITRQLFTYLFFFTNTNIFNKLLVEDAGRQYYNWQSGVRIRANLSQLEDWATQNGLEDEFGQMFERLLAVTELLATSKNTLVKYQWPMMKTHYQPLTSAQLYHVLYNYQLGKPVPVIWAPSPEEMEDILQEDTSQLPLSTHPPFALPDNCGMVDLIRTPEDTSFWNHLRRLKSLYGNAEDDSDSGFSISNTPRDSCLTTNGEPFYELDNEENVAAPTARPERKQVPKSALALLVQKQNSKIPVKKSHANNWSYKVPKPATGVCNCVGNSACGEVTQNTLASDLMEEEQRERVESADFVRESKSKCDPVKTSQSQSYQPKVCSKVNQSSLKSTVRDGLKTRYQKNNHLSGNVADCSARTLPKSLQIRERSNSMGVRLRQAQIKAQQSHSYSVEDLPMRLTRQRPSASFEEAIERGYTSDVNRKSESTSEEDLPNSKSKYSNVESKPSKIPRNGFIRRHKSLVNGRCTSTSSDDVFVQENCIDNFYKDYRSDSVSKSMPYITTTSFKPIPTSDKLRNSSKKLMAVSFDSESRRSSIELTRDNLFLHNADDNMSAADDTSDTDAQEMFPGELFTEVNESTLAALKRHGSSLNVAPSSENSPRISAQQYEKVCEVIGFDDDNRKMASCPLYTVYLKKQAGGLGLALINGLHTTLHLAGIYIRKIQPDSPAAKNGCLQIGDRILAVDGRSMAGASYQSTMNAIKEAGETLTLLIARGNESMATKISISQV